MCALQVLQGEHNGSTVWGRDEEGTENFSNSPNWGVLSADPALGQKREEWQQGTPSSAATIHCDRSISPHTGAFLSFSINCEVISLILYFNTLTGCSWFKLLLTKNKRYDLQCNAMWKSEPEGKNKGTWLFPQHTNSTFVLLDSFSSPNGQALQAAARRTTVLCCWWKMGLWDFHPLHLFPQPLIPGPSPYQGSMLFQLCESNQHLNQMSGEGSCGTRTPASNSEREQTVLLPMARCLRKAFQPALPSILIQHSTCISDYF